MEVKPSLLILAILLVTFDRTLSEYGSGFCGGGDMATMLGGVDEPRGGTANTVEAEALARFAVNEHNKNHQNAVLDFVRVVEANEQVVAGTLHHLTIEAVEAGKKKKKLYEAKVWVKPWLNFKELQEFKHAGDVPTFTSSDLGAKQGDHASGWREVPSHDPAVQDAANHALKTIQERSNSLFSYELQEVVRANAELVDESTKFDMLLKVKRGTAEEKFKVEVHRNLDGAFHLNRMEPHN